MTSEVFGNGDQKDRKRVQLENGNMVIGMFAFIGTTIAGIIGILWRKVSGMETRAALLDQARAHHESLRAEDRADRESARKAIVERIDLHHTVVIDKVDGLAHRVERLEKTVKNGH